ncbi:protein eva-1 homolog C isoform X1 [Tachysurus ichikawai]
MFLPDVAAHCALLLGFTCLAAFANTSPHFSGHSLGSSWRKCKCPESEVLITYELIKRGESSVLVASTGPELLKVKRFSGPEHRERGMMAHGDE